MLLYALGKLPREGLSMRGRTILTLVSAATLVLAGELQTIQAGAAPRDSAAAWTIETPIAPTLPNGFFNGVSCADSTHCMAVGDAGIPNTTTPDTAVLAALWNGTKWTQEALTEPKGAMSARLSGVSCSSAASCLAVGSFTPARGTEALAESWNGTKWAIVAGVEPPKASGAQLESASCVSPTSCIAVGNQDMGTTALNLAEAWNGKSWTVLKTPSSSGNYEMLYGVSCHVGSCLAVGTSSHGTTQAPSALSWNGKSWTKLAPLAPADREGALTGVSCPAASSCTAVGTYLGKDTEPLLESWNGSKWSYMKGPSAPLTFDAVSCFSTTSCLEVGQTLGKVAAASWNGSVWKATASPASSPPDVHPGLNGVACTSTTACLAVGENVTAATTAIVTLATSWNGTG
ncbi:MAG TPA: hypothetical protein VGP46_06395, partial [Acidimicrobiales bacterium]|nr:hypothetical protein [Acidimicrobiales bacterium]